MRYKVLWTKLQINYKHLIKKIRMKVNNLNKLLVKFNLTMKKKLQSIELMISKEKLIKIYKIY